MPAFWDASAIVPVCVPVQDHRALRHALRKHPPVVWWGTRIEVRGAVRRLCRSGLLTEEQGAAARSRLEQLARSWREVQPTERLRELAENLLDRHTLRAADALQLAAALVWSQGRSRGRSFLCRDLRLAEAARREGFSVIEI